MGASFIYRICNKYMLPFSLTALAKRYLPLVSFYRGCFSSLFPVCPVKGVASSPASLSLRVDNLHSVACSHSTHPLSPGRNSLHVLNQKPQTLSVCCLIRVLGQNLLETGEHSQETFQGRPESGLTTPTTRMQQGQSAAVPVTGCLAPFPFCGSEGPQLCHGPCQLLRCPPSPQGNNGSYS